MPPLELFVIYNTVSGRIDIIKSRKLANRINLLYGKLYDLLNLNEKTICMEAYKFFNSHHVEKSNIYFSWDLSVSDKMFLYKSFLGV